MKKNISITKGICALALAGCLAGCENAGEQSLYSFGAAFYINKATLSMYKGEQIQLQVSPRQNSSLVSWLSNNENVVTVAGGVVEAVDVGSTDIIATCGDERRTIPVTVTVPGVDEVTARGGEGRLTLDVHIGNDRIKTVKVINDTTGVETTIDIAGATGVFHVPFTGLPEDDYSFTVYGIDMFDHPSAEVKVVCRVVGDAYKAGLANRTFKAATLWGNCCGIGWSNAVGDFIDLYYTNEQGEATVKRVVAGANYAISGFKKGSALSYRTVFLPSEAALDTFYMPVENVAVTDKSYTVTSSVPCEIFARDFDYGGEGVGFHDTGTSNTARSYRTDLGDNGSEAVRLDDATHLNIGSYGAGDWYAYTVDVQDEGDYEVDVLYGTTGTAGVYSIEIEQEKSTDIPLNKSTGGWQNYQWCNAFLNIDNPPVFHLTPGRHRIKVVLVATGINFKSFKLTWKAPVP
ncbi:MAG: carbohydrate-binding protein [Bacteroidales bacterium]|jgi:hypothetical protein|nr:carbohydrate-binding protein [Bacteroidales bacterium]